MNGGIILNNKIPLSQKGVPNGVATLGADGKIPASQIPTDTVTSVFGRVGAISAQSGDYSAALISYLAASRTTATNVGSVLDRTFYAVDFGVVADGATDNAAAIEAMATTVDGLGGGIIIYPTGTIKTNSKIDIDNLTYPQTHRGQGANETIFKFTNAATTTGSLFEITTSDYFRMEDCTIDCNYAINTTGGHGISVFNCNYPYFKNVKVSDWKDSAILIYSDSAGDYVGGVIDNCIAISDGTANNGFNIVDMWYSGYIGSCFVEGAAGSPGYGIQFKNDCRYCFSEPSVEAVSCKANFALGQDSGIGVKYSAIRGISKRPVQNGFIAGCSVGADVDLVIDMELQGNEAVLLNGTNINYNMSGKFSIYNVDRNKNAVRLTGGNNNQIKCPIITGGNSQLVRFESGVADNRVQIDNWAPYGAEKTITAVTNANPGVFTSAGHGYPNGAIVYLQDMGGMPSLNGRTYLVKNATTDTFTLDELNNSTDVDTSALGSYTGGGIVARQLVDNTADATPTSLTNDSSGNTSNQTIYRGFKLYSDICPLTTVASAATLDLTPENSGCTSITGTTTITAVTLPEGARRFCKAGGAFTITNGASLITTTGADIVTADGDTFLLVGEASGIVRMHYYTRASDVPVQANVASGSAVSVTTDTVTPITSVSLAAGTYLIVANPAFIGTTLTATFLQAFLSTASGASTTGQTVYNTSYTTPPSAGSDRTVCAPISAPIVIPAGGATVYLKVLATFSLGTLTAFGGISAIKINP